MQDPKSQGERSTISYACGAGLTADVQCDGVGPICQRCEKSKRICIPGLVAKQPSFSIHVENEYACGKSKRPRGPRSSLTAPRPQVDLETKALAYYQQYHLQLITDAPISCGGLSECVAAWRSSGWRDEMVDLALLSMALAVYSNTQDDPLAGTEASTKYGRLLQMVQNRINKVVLPTLSEKDIDACLLTIFLMGRYEGVMHQPETRPQKLSQDQIQGLSHHEGVMAILEVWNESLSHTNASEIVKQTRRGQIRSAILRNRLLPEWLHDGSRFGEQGVGLDFDRLTIRTVILRESLGSVQRNPDVQIIEIKRLSQEALNIDDELNTWMSQFGDTCPRQEHVLPSSEKVPREHIYSRRAYSYMKPGHAATWTQYLGATMLVNSTHLRILDSNHPDFLANCSYRRLAQLERISRLKVAADDLASTVPFCLAKIKVAGRDQLETKGSTSVLVNKGHYKDPSATGPGLLIWSLTIAAGLEGIDEQQQKWFRSELASAGRAVGDRVLSRCDIDEWPFSI